MANKPMVMDEAAAFYNAYILLQSSRTFDFNGNPNAIPLSEILAFCNLFGYDTLEERHSVLKFVRVCDKTYLDEKGARNGNNTKSRSRQHGRGTRRR